MLVSSTTATLRRSMATSRRIYLRPAPRYFTYAYIHDINRGSNATFGALEPRQLMLNFSTSTSTSTTDKDSTSSDAVNPAEVLSASDLDSKSPEDSISNGQKRQRKTTEELRLLRDDPNWPPTKENKIFQTLARAGKPMTTAELWEEVKTEQIVESKRKMKFFLQRLKMSGKILAKPDGPEVKGSKVQFTFRVFEQK
mmetsp:Transcript_12155/g.14183  ORF Transcript_12155/g.14183 Transcript_12155/m.14183 type:complete len:197 (+) Transcript_12155:56-646(+)